MSELKKALISLKNDGLIKFGKVNLGDVDNDTCERLKLFEYEITTVAKLKDEIRKEWISKQNMFDLEYYETGIQCNKSGYENYHWMPELTMRMVHHMITQLGIKNNQKVLDFGCAKGFSVKSFRMFGIDAYGVDVSSYAIHSVEHDQWNTHQNCKLIINWNMPFKKVKFDWVIAKDVIEHLNENEVQKFLKLSKKHTKNLFVVAPLGKKVNNKDSFVIEHYEGDISHILRKPVSWWKEIFQKNGWKITKFAYTMPPIKENWTSLYPKGNGFFILKNDS